MSNGTVFQEPKVCIDQLCPRSGVQILGGGQICINCHSEMISYSVYRELLDGEMRRSFDGRHEIGDDLPTQLQNLEMEFTRTHTNLPLGNDTFTCPPDLTGCPIARKTSVLVPLEMYYQWVFFAKQISTEWIAYLTGEEKDEFTIKITGMYFPKQKANGAHVEAEDGEIINGTIAAVHSHVGMEAFFSHEDKDHFNHRVEMVVNNRGDIKANSRTKLECGRFHRGDADVLFIGDEQLRGLMDLKSKIEPDRTRFQTNNPVQSIAKKV
jgi:hypothetical protein